MIIAFDLDGTLINTEAWTLKNLLRTFKKFGYKATKSDIVKLWGNSTHVMSRKLFPSITLKEAKEISKYFNEYRMKYLKEVKPFKNTIKTLKKLKGKYKLALLSNNKRDDILKLMKQTKIKEDWFEIIAGEDQVKNPKPQPDMILYAQRKLKKKITCLVGDSKQDIKAAKKAGIISILVETGPKRQGILRPKPNFTVKEIGKIPELLERGIK